MTTTNVQPDTANAGPALTANPGSAVTFSQATASGVGPLTYAWNFGDGSTATGALNPTHTYQNSGTYTAQLTVTDALGISATSTMSVTVSRSGATVPTVSAGSPVDSQCGLIVHVQPGDGERRHCSLLIYLDLRGRDDQTGSLDPSHTYANPGTYTATVTVTDANKLWSSSSAVVTVNNVPPTASVSFPTSGIAGVTGQFRSHSDGRQPGRSRRRGLHSTGNSATEPLGPAPTPTTLIRQPVRTPSP